jgi:2,3-dihydroxybenzoate-AMP ligase
MSVTEGTSPRAGERDAGPGGTGGPRLAGVTGWPDELALRYREAGYWRPETLDGLLRSWVARSGADVALVDGGPTTHRLTYAELDERVESTARGLRALGLAREDRVVVQLPNTPDFVVVLFALLRLGAVPVLALPAHRALEIGHLVELSGAAGYVIPERHDGFDHLALAGEIAGEIDRARPGSLHVVVAGGDPGPFTALDALPPGRQDPWPDVDPAEVAVLLVSGGTTGRPKLIPRTHQDYAYNARASAEVCALGPADVYLASLPVAHNFPLACPGLLGALGVGARVVLAPEPGPDLGLGLVEREGVTVTALVPPMARMWVQAAGWDRRDRSSLRLLQVGGAKLDAELAARIPPALGCAVQQVFGMAEGLLNYTRLDDPPDVVTGTQGRPLSADDEVRVVDRAGRDVPPGEVGELWTRGPYTLRGYYRAPEHNATAFSPDGFYRSGDLVRRLPSGHLVVTGRVKDVINRGGENVPAATLEEHLLDHPDIAAAAVLGQPDAYLGERVCAVVVLAEGAEQAPRPTRLREWLGARGLARFYAPDRVVARPSFPLTAVGKVDKRALAAELAEERAPSGPRAAPGEFGGRTVDTSQHNEHRKVIMATGNEWTDGLPDPRDAQAVVRAFAANPAFRAAEWEELTTEDNPYRRPVRPDDLGWLDYSKAMPVRKVLRLSGLLGHRMLRNVYDADLLLLPPAPNPVAGGDERDFHSARARVLGGLARPVLERHLFTFLDEIRPERPADGLAGLTRRVAEHREQRAAEPGAAFDAVAATKGQREAGTFLLLQLSAYQPARYAALGRAALGEYEEAAPGLRARLLGDYAGWVGHADRYRKLLARGGLRTTVGAYWQLCLNSSLARGNHAHRLATDRSRPFDFLGELVHRRIDEETTRARLAEVLGEALDEGSGEGAGEGAAAALAPLGGDDVAPPSPGGPVEEWLPALLGPLHERFGDAVLDGVHRGFTDAAWFTDLWHRDLSAQVSWADRIEEYQEKAEKIEQHLSNENIEVDLDTFVETSAETSTTHVHDDHRLVMIEVGQMHFWNNVTHKIQLNQGDKLLIPTSRLHGSTVLSGSCTYHQPIIPDEMFQQFDR